jgi:septum formation protein
MPVGLSVEDTVIFLACQKVESVKDKCSSGFVIGADTVVYNGRIIGKPKDKDEAISVLEELRNKEHCVATGVAILNAESGQTETFCEKTIIRFGDYSRDEIEAYVATGEPLDKAGSYALHQGWKSHAIKVTGDHENAIGFPWQRIRQTLISMGYEF